MKIPYIPYIVIRSDKMFFIGDGLFYPRFSAGIVTNIEEKEIYGITKKYYIIRLISNGMLTMIPVDFEDSKRLRKLIEKNDYKRIKEILTEQGKTLPIKWSDRYKLYNNCINKGDIFELTMILRDIHNMSKQKDVSKSDLKIFEEMLSMVASELSIVLEIDYEEMKIIVLNTLKGGNIEL